MRPDDRTHDRDDQHRNLRNTQQDRFSGRGHDQPFRDDDRGFTDRANEVMDRAGDTVRSWFGNDENQFRGDFRDQDRDFGGYGPDDEARRHPLAHSVGYSGQGYPGGMGSYAHGSQGQFANPGQGNMSPQYGQHGFGQGNMSPQYGLGQGNMSPQYGLGQGNMSPQYGQSRQSQYGMVQDGQSGPGQYGQGSQYGMGQYGQGSMGRYEGSSRQGQYGGQGMGQYGQGMQGQYGQGMQGQFGQGMQGQYGQGMQGQHGGLTRGRHIGRGPKGYKRSDERLTEEINEKLTQHPDINAEEIEVKVQSGEVTLTGTVEDRHTKRMVEDLVEEISGVNELHNRLRIHRNRGQQASMTQQGLSGSMPQQGAMGLSGSQSAQSSMSQQGSQSGAGFGSSTGSAGTGEHTSTGSPEKSRGSKSSS